MKILLTGSTGFIGRHLKDALFLEGHEVVCLSRVSRYGVAKKVDAVINCAGELDNYDKMLDSNLTLVTDLLNFTKSMSVGKFIQIGSSAETGPIEGIRSETTFCQPSNLYEATKLAATNLCLGYASEFNIDISVARPFTVYGNDDKPRKMLPTLWRAYCEGTVFNCYSGGHDWIHVNDFVSGVIAMLDSPPSVTAGQIFHFGTGISTDNEAVVKTFEQAAGSFFVKYHTGKLRLHDVMNWTADSSKARARLGWKPKFSLEAGIKDFVMVEYFKRELVPGL